MTEPSGPVREAPIANPGCVLGILFGAIIGGSCVGLIFISGLRLTWNLKSTDFLSAVLSALGAMLGAVSVLLVLFSLVLAVAAFFGWQELKRGTGETATGVAQAAAIPAARDAAIPAANEAAVERVGDYLLTLEPSINKQIVARIGQIVTPEFIASVLREVQPMPPKGEPPVDAPEQGFPEERVKEAAVEETERQEAEMDALDAAVEAEEIRGDAAGEADS